MAYRLPKNFVERDWEHRYYSFDSRWSDGGMMASMRDGSGNSWFTLFTKDGALLQGCWHESPLLQGGTAPAWIMDGVPPNFRDNFVSEPAFESSRSTFCIWRAVDDERWRSSSEKHPSAAKDDGSSDLLSILESGPDGYVEFCRAYYELDISADDVASVFSHHDLGAALLLRLGGNTNAVQLQQDLDEIGYRGALRT